MTGYASRDLRVNQRDIRLHLKSVNHRFFDLKFRAPRSWTAYEVACRNTIKDQIVRGACEFWVEESKPDESQKNSAQTMQNFFEQLRVALDASPKSFGLAVPKPIRALILARFPHLWLKDSDEQKDHGMHIEFGEFEQTLQDLCAALKAQRLAEGAKIQKMLLDEAAQLEQCLTAIESRIPQLRKTWDDDYRKRLDTAKELINLKTLNEDKILQELLLVSEKRDVAEEIQRARSHIEQLRHLGEGKLKGSGKFLEFLLQESLREWNTLGNKIQNSEISTAVIDAKLSIERCKEQSLNIA
jgi:uncharacterized protein (TIGR00255 family)